MADRRLCYAAKAGDIATVKQLVQGGADVNAKDDEYGNNALMKAASCGHLEVIRYLVEQGADKDAKTTRCLTALMWAVGGHLDVVRYLVEQDADVNAKTEDGSTALIYAAREGYLDVVMYLVDQGADVTAKNKNGWTALLWAAPKGHLDVMQYLKKQSADTVDNGGTALLEAACGGHLDVVRYLVEQGANGMTALAKAIQDGNLSPVRILLDSGVGIDTKNKNGETSLIMSARVGHLEVARYLVKEDADVNAKDNKGDTALMAATRKGHLEMVLYLGELDTDKDAKNGSGKTALMLAARLGRLNVMRYLVNRDVDASCLDNEGNSALVLLLQRKDADENKILPIVKQLMDRGAPPLKSNRQGKSARSIAKVKGFHHIAALVKEYASKPQPEPKWETTRWLISHDDIVKTPTALASGSFGTVYRAKWVSSDVVVKEITVVAMRQFLKEVKTWSELRHDNVVPFYGANHQKETFFIVPKYASKGELVPYLKSEKEKGRTVTWRKLKEVAAGLSYLHGHEPGIVHGDLKGNNIVVSEDGTTMLTDFGLSFSESGSCSVKKRKDTLGAMAWRAPEFVQPGKKLTCKSDVYSLGMCIIEAVTCENPWSGYADYDIRDFLRRGEIKVEKPDSMTDDQWELVERMSMVSPDDRPDVADVLPELERFAADEESGHEYPY